MRSFDSSHRRSRCACALGRRPAAGCGGRRRRQTRRRRRPGRRDRGRRRPGGPEGGVRPAARPGASRPTRRSEQDVPEGRDARVRAAAATRSSAASSSRPSSRSRPRSSDVKVTDEEVDKRLDELKKQFFDGDEQKYQAELEKQGLTEEQVLKDLRTRHALGEDLREGHERRQGHRRGVEAYYDENKAQFTKPATREVRHILVKTKAKADAALPAARGRRRLREARQAVLARTRPRRSDGGKFTAQQGRDRRRRSTRSRSRSKTGELSEPVKTQFGWHIIEARRRHRGGLDAGRSPTSRSRSRRRCSRRRRTRAINEWISELAGERFEDQIVYAPGFEPPPKPRRRPARATPARPEPRPTPSSPVGGGDGLGRRSSNSRSWPSGCGATAPGIARRRRGRSSRTRSRRPTRSPTPRVAGDDAKLRRRARRPPLPDRLPALLLEERGAGDLARGRARRSTRSSSAGTRTSSATPSSRLAGRGQGALGGAEARAGGARGDLPRRARDASRAPARAQGAAARGLGRLRLPGSSRTRSATSTTSWTSCARRARGRARPGCRDGARRSRLRRARRRALRLRQRRAAPERRSRARAARGEPALRRARRTGGGAGRRGGRAWRRRSRSTSRIGYFDRAKEAHSREGRSASTRARSSTRAGNPTVEVEVELESGALGRAAVPSGASTGPVRGGRAARRRQDGLSRQGRAQGGRERRARDRPCARRAPMPAIRRAVDRAADRARRHAQQVAPRRERDPRRARWRPPRPPPQRPGVPLYRWIGGEEARVLPVPLMNVVNGGAHAQNSLDLQEFMVVPAGAASFSEALRIGAEIFHRLKELLHERGLATGVGDEGGFAPDLGSSEEAIEAVLEAAERAGHTRPRRHRARPGDHRALATTGRYRLAGREAATSTPTGMIAFWDEPLRALSRSSRSRTGSPRTTGPAGAADRAARRPGAARRRRPLRHERRAPRSAGSKRASRTRSSSRSTRSGR